MLPKDTDKLDPRTRRTRQMIIQAFNDLVTDQGFQGLGVQEITDRAGINRATFYAHFADKYALLDHAIQQEFRAEIDRRMLNACHFSMDNLRNLVAAVCEFVARSHGHCPLSEQQFQSLIETQIRGQVYELIHHWLENMPVDSGYPMSREHAATAATWALYGLAVDWSRAKRTPPIDEYANEVLPLLAASLGLSIELA